MITFYKDNDIVGLAHELASLGTELSEMGAQRGGSLPYPIHGTLEGPIHGSHEYPIHGSLMRPMNG